MPEGALMVDEDMKVVFLLLAFVAALYGMAMFVDNGPAYRDPPSILPSVEALAVAHAHS
jgi:hypothetical protein